MFNVRIHGYHEGEGNIFNTFEQAERAAREWFFTFNVTWYCTIENTETAETFVVFWWGNWHTAKVVKAVSADDEFSKYLPLGDRCASIYWSYGDYSLIWE